MARKEFFGISSENNRLRIAKVCKTNNGIEVVGVDMFDLPFALSSSRDTTEEPMDFADEFEDLFDSGVSTGGDTDYPGLDDSFDMTSMEDETDVATENERLFAEYLSKLGDKKYRFGLHIPFGKTTYQFFKNVDPGEMKKKERHEFFIDKLRPIHNREAEPDEYAWSTDPKKNTLLAYNSEDKSLISLIELAETYFKGKLIIQERVPDENIWSGLASINYHLEDDDITGLIAIGKSTSRILFMRGEHIINVLPIITEGESSEDILNTIFSKILFEIDKGDLPKITRLLIVKSLKLTDKVKSYFQNQLEDVDVELLTLNPNIVSYSDDILDSPNYLQPYLTAIGAAWAASGEHSEKLTGFSILPEYIREKQPGLKLEWHGILLLVFIALTPLFINFLYNNKASELREIEQQIQLAENEIAEHQPIANMTEDLMTEYALMQSENNRLLELSQYSQKWSQVFDIFNSGIDNISGVWLTSLTSEGDNMSITGISLTREQVPNISSLYYDGNVQQVQETEIREQPVYSYSMQINNYKSDLEEFVPEIPTPNFNLEYNSSTSLAFQGADGSTNNFLREETDSDYSEAESSVGENKSPPWAGANESAVKDSLEVVTLQAQLLDERQVRRQQEEFYRSNIEKLKTQIDSLEKVLSLVFAGEQSRQSIDTIRADWVSKPDSFIVDEDDYTADKGQKELYSETQVGEHANTQKAVTHENDRSFLWLLYTLLTLIVLGIIIYAGRLLFLKDENGQPGDESDNQKDGKGSPSPSSSISDISTTDNKLIDNSMGDEKDDKSKVDGLDDFFMSDESDDKSKVDDLDDFIIANESNDKSKVDDLDDFIIADESDDKSKSDDLDEKSIADESEDKSKADDLDERSVADESEDKIKADDLDERSVAEISEDKIKSDDLDEKSIADESEDKTKAGDLDEKSFADESEDKSKADESEDKSKADESEDKSKADDLDERSVANESEVSTKESELSDKRIPSYSVPEHTRKIESKESKTLPKSNTVNRSVKVANTPKLSEAIPEYTITVLSSIKRS